MSVERRRQVIEPEHPRLSIARQCELVSISRSGLCHRPAGETPLNLALMRLIDAQFLETPWVHPYLLRDLVVDKPDQVWCADLTHIPMRRGFLYLVAIDRSL